MAWEFDNNTALKNDNEPQWELEGTKPVTQSVMDDRDGKIYNVPLAYDGVDTRFAIDTQHKGADKGSFFGKVFMDVAKMTTALTSSPMAAKKMLPDEISFESVKDAARGVVGSFEGFVDNKLVEATDIRRKQRIAAGKTYNAGYGDPLRDMAFDWELPTEEEQEEAKKLVETAQKIRDANKQWWNSAKEAIKPEETMDETDKFIEALSGGATSMAISMGSMLPFKSATVGAALIAAEYGKMAGNQFFDEAVKNGMDFDEAYTAAFGRGGIEAGLELVADTTLAKIGNLKAIQDISNRVISSGLVKAAQSKLGKSAIQKIGTRHTNSVFGAALKGFGSEGGTEALQQSLGMFYDNAAGIADYSLDQILGETLFAAVIGGITGGLGAGGGTLAYNRQVVDTNERIKKVLQEQTPDLTAEETQTMADALQEMLFQESTGYMTELNKVMEKELAPDVRQEGLTPEQLTSETRKLLKEKYKMSDEDINKTIQSALSVIDARNQFNEAYTIFNEGLTNAGRDAARADGEARILAARALSVARAQGTQVKDVLDRWNLQFRQTAWNEGEIDKGAKNVDVKNVGYADFRNFIDEESNPVTEEVFNKIKEAISTYGNNISYQELMDKVGKELDADMNAASMSNSDFMEVFDYIAEPNQQALLQGRVVDTIKSFFKPVAKDVSNFRNFFRKAIRGELSENTILQISERTPEIYKRLGLDDKPMGIANKTIAKANIGKHNVPLNILEELPEFIFDPIAVLDSKTSEGSFVAILNAVDDNGDTVVAIIKPTKGKYNIVPSVYGKDDLDNLIKSSNIRYKDIERANIVIRPSSLQLLGVDNTVSSLTKSSMTQNEQNVNSLLQQRALFQESLDIANQNAELDANNPAYEGETINIDGVERTVYNSNGDRIAKSKSALENFYKWFGDSKVVDGQGRPLVVYHGTDFRFSEFRMGGGVDFPDAAYFSSNKNIAKTYTNTSNIMKLYLKMENPYITDAEGQSYNKFYDSLVSDMDWAVRNEYDGVIIRRIRDDWGQKGKGGKVGDTYAVFEPNQIKSTSNRGTYSESDNIYYQSAFHGTPFPELEGGGFKLEKIGTGENAQAHGYGLYYTASYDVADKRYRERLTKPYTWFISFGEVEFDKKTGKYKNAFNETTLEFEIYKDFKLDAGEDIDVLLKSYEQTRFLDNRTDEKIAIVNKYKDYFVNNDVHNFSDESMATGQVYEVDLPENPYLLDEQKPFNEQSDIVKKGIIDTLNSMNLTDEQKARFRDNIENRRDTGKEIYEELIIAMAKSRGAGLQYSSKENMPFVSKALAENGVKGITYWGRQDGRCFVIFNPDDVKVIQKFYQDGADMLYRDPRGAYQNSIIYLFENADASTVIHELGHFFLDDMQKFADNETTKAQLEAIYKYVGSTDGNLTVEQHEYFANSFEVYLLEGRAPNKTLEKVFLNFRKWISRIWSEIKRLSGINLTPEIRKVFDEMLGGRGLDFAMQMSGARMAEALESGTIPPNVIAKAIELLETGKMSRADMDDLITRMKTGELKRKDFNQELKKFEAGNVKHNERLNPFDKVKYKDILSKGNFSKKDVLEKINRLLKWTEPRTQNGKLVGRFSNLKMNQEFDHIRELMNMEKAQAKEKLDENIKLINAMIRGEETGDMDRLVFDNKILTIRLNKANASLLLDVYNAISDSYNMGRLTTAITGEARRARKNRLVNEAVHVLTADGDVDWRRERSKFKQFVNQLGTSQMSWQGILDILSMNDKTSKTGQSLLVQNLDVFDAQQKEAEGLAEDGEKASRFMEKKLKGVGNAAISVSRYVNSKLDEKFTIQWGLNKKTFTKDQLLDIYMKSKDDETRKMMAEDPILQYNERFLSEVNEILTAEDRAIAEALFEFYDDNYAKINAFYEEKYGTSLGKRAFYSPRSMDRGGVNVDTGDLSSYAGFSGVKERKAKAGAVKIKGAFQVLQDYIVNSNHWIAWSDKLIDINAVMGDVEVKNIIRNLFGEGMEKRIGYEVSRMASNDKFQSKFGYGKLFNKIRSNYAIAALAAKPSLMIKQLTSFPAYWEHMSTAEFMSGLADFAIHMKEAVETLGNTTLMKTRDVNIIKDFEELSKSELFKKNANKVKLRELLMANIKLGDRGAIYMGGWALYKAELKKNLAKGMGEEKAKALALEKFERVTDETQQSGRLSQQSYWQSNPFLRAFTMFQSSQNQYLRKEINAIRGLATGRMDPKQAAKTLFIFHVLLPSFFQYASDGFDWDEKAQLRAALLGSLNGIFILNGILERGLDYALGTADVWKATSTALSDVLPFWGSGEDLAKFFIDLAEGDIDLEDYVEVIRAFGKPLGELTGIPFKYPLDVIQNFGSYAEEGEVKKEVLLWLGWSPYALRDKEED